MAIDSLPELYRGLMGKGLLVPENGTRPLDTFADPYDDPNFNEQAFSEEAEVLEVPTHSIAGLDYIDPVEGREGAAARSARSSIVIKDPTLQLGARLSLLEGHLPAVVEYTGIEYQTEEKIGNQVRVAADTYRNSKLDGVCIGIGTWSQALSVTSSGRREKSDGGYHLVAYRTNVNREMSGLSADDPARAAAETLYGVAPSGDRRDLTRGILFEGRIKPLDGGLALYKSHPLTIPEDTDQSRFELAQRVNANVYLREPFPGVPSLVTRLMSRAASRIRIS